MILTNTLNNEIINWLADLEGSFQRLVFTLPASAIWVLCYEDSFIGIVKSDLPFDTDNFLKGPSNVYTNVMYSS